MMESCTSAVPAGGDGGSPTLQRSSLTPRSPLLLATGIAPSGQASHPRFRGIGEHGQPLLTLRYEGRRMVAPPARLDPLMDAATAVSPALAASAPDPEGVPVEEGERPPLPEDAYFDDVTGLPRLTLLRLRARQLLALARRRGETAALLHVDIDRLEVVNQTRGRSTGDELLRAVGRRIQDNVRESDTLCRLEEDEYIVLLSEVADGNAAGRVAHRLGQALSLPYRLGGEDLDARVHLGLALYPQDAVTLDALLEDAAVALKRAKATDATFEFVGQEQSEVSRDSLSLESDLGWAWNDDQFTLHYQPILSVGTGRMVGAEALARGTVVGVEALARWIHPVRGTISPAQFIPLAERTGRIVALDRWAVATAARQAAAWVLRGWAGWVSVNLSARSLHDPDLPDYVGRTLRSHGLAWDRVVLEVTETTAMRDPHVTAKVLRRLREAGALIAVDDFGIGHSSLAYLKHFPVDLLKLDRSFVAEVGKGTLDEELVEVMINLAHRIGARVVAEGVERDEQFEWLRTAGCDFIQGFLVGRPVPPDQVHVEAADSR